MNNLNEVVSFDNRKAMLLAELPKKSRGIPSDQLARILDDDQDLITELWMKEAQAVEVVGYSHEYREDKHHRIIRTRITPTSKKESPSEWTPPDTVCVVFCGPYILIGITPLHVDTYPGLDPFKVYEYRLARDFSDKDLSCI